MNESAEYTRLLAQAYSKLADDYSAMWKREDAARAEIHKLEELVENWSAEATKQSERADAAEDRVKELEELLEKWALHAARESERADAAEAYVQALEEVCDSEQLKCAQAAAHDECDRSEAIRQQLLVSKNDYKAAYEIIEGYRCEVLRLKRVADLARDAVESGAVEECYLSLLRDAVFALPNNRLDHSKK